MKSRKMVMFTDLAEWQRLPQEAEYKPNLSRLGHKFYLLK
jgi:hypothetical protein